MLKHEFEHDYSLIKRIGLPNTMLANWTSCPEISSFGRAMTLLSPLALIENARQVTESSINIKPARSKAHPGFGTMAGSTSPVDNPLGRSIAALVLLWLYFIRVTGRPSRSCWRLKGESK